MKAADYTAAFLKEKGVTHVFELVGGMITFLIDAMHQAGGIRIVSVHHEQAAGFAAEGWARVTGVPGVALATSGPGATNLLTAIGSCYFDSVPTVFITGQVNTHEMKKERPIRQLGFQETDIVAMARPVTKAAWQASSAAEVPALLARAFALAVEGRPGPVLLDLPMDVQRQEIPDEAAFSLPAAPAEADPAAAAAAIVAGLASAARPLILAGGGLRSSGSVAAFRRLVEKTGVPVVHSLMGVDLLPASDPRRVGMIGSYGNRHANHALSHADFLLVLGSRLDVRQTGADTAGFKGGRVIHHVDCEEGEMNNRVQGCVAVPASLPAFLAAALAFPAPGPGDHRAWLGEIDRLRQQWPDDREYLGGGINPNLFLRQLSESGAGAAAYVADVGQHQMWAAQSLRLGPDQRFLTSGGMGAMGFSLPAAIGACLGAQTRPVVVVAGDGGFQCNLQELQTVARNRLPLKIVILNNRCHGMVRQFQETYFAGRYQSTLWGYDAPSFAAVAGAYGIAARELAEPGGTAAAIDWLWSDPAAPALLEVLIEPMGNVYPKMAFGRPLHEMEPAVQPTAMEST